MRHLSCERWRATQKRAPGRRERRLDFWTCALPVESAKLCGAMGPEALKLVRGLGALALAFPFSCLCASPAEPEMPRMPLSVGTVTAVRRQEGAAIKVYNLKVDRARDYTVGAGAVLVHNTSIDWRKFSIDWGTFKIYDSKGVLLTQTEILTRVIAYNKKEVDRLTQLLEEKSQKLKRLLDAGATKKSTLTNLRSDVSKLKNRITRTINRYETRKEELRQLMEYLE